MAAWLNRHGVYLFAGFFFLGFGVKFLRDDAESLWRTTYVLAAQEMLAGEQIYHLGNYCYAYPPAMAMYAIPLSELPEQLSLWGWYGVNILATCVAFTRAWRLVGGPQFTALNGLWRVVFWMTLALAARHVLSPLENRQSDMCIAAFALAGCWALARGKDIWAGCLIGISASMKLTPLLFVPYLAWRGKWRSAALVGAVCLGVNLVPDVLFPQNSGRLYLAEWRRVFFTEAKATAPGQWAQEEPIGQLRLNQSLSALYHRYVMFGLPTSSAQLETLDLNMSARAHAAIRWLTHGTALLLLGLTAWRFGAPGRVQRLLSPTSSLPAPTAEMQTAAECGAVFSLMVLVSPMSSKAHYVVLLLPCLVVVRLLVEQRRPWLIVASLLLFVSGPLTSKGIIGKHTGDVLALWGFPTYYALVCLASMWLALNEIRRAAASENRLTISPCTTRARAA